MSSVTQSTVYPEHRIGGERDEGTHIISSKFEEKWIRIHKNIMLFAFYSNMNILVVNIFCLFST